MIDGYWTCLLCVMLLILLATGWKSWLAQYINVRLILLGMISIWLSHLLSWNYTFQVDDYSVGLNLSVAFIILLSLMFPTDGALYKWSMLLMYTTLFGLLWTMIRALIIFSPWAEANIELWYIALLSGIIAGALGIKLEHFGAILLLSSIGEEVLLVFQQKGEYVAAIGSLMWWDIFSQKAFFGVLFILFFHFVEYSIPNVLNFVQKRRGG